MEASQLVPVADFPYQNAWMIYPSWDAGNVVTSQSSEFQVNFTFCRQEIGRLWQTAENPDGQPTLISEHSRPPVKTQFEVKGYEQFMRKKEAIRIMAENLRQAPSWDSRCRWATRLAYRKARDIVEEKPSDHNVIDLEFTVLLYYNVYCEEGDSAEDSSDEEDSGGMVPASEEEVIGCLERMTVAPPSDECAICLEDLQLIDSKNYRECARLPCLHVFHGDCIQKWLQISHYCPLCRFELRTS